MSRLPYEGGPERTLWLPSSVDVEHVMRWVDGARSVLTRLRPDDLESPDACATGVTLVIMRDALINQLEISASSHEAGLLHHVAAQAAAEGHRALVKDGDGFRGDAPFFVFTEYLHGHAPRAFWFDPLRGMTGQGVALDDLLTQHHGERVTAEAYALNSWDRGGYEWLSSTELVSDGRVNTTPRWTIHRPEEFGGEEFSVVSAVFGLCLALGIAFCVPPFWLSLGNPQRVSEALVPTIFGTLSVAWLALLPLRWPTGRRLSWKVKLIAFVLFPSLMPALVVASSKGLS